MKKVFKVENLDCANCAAKVEALINKVDGVNVASLNFMAGKLTVDFEGDNYESAMEEILRVAKKIEKDIVIK